MPTKPALASIVLWSIKGLHFSHLISSWHFWSGSWLKQIYVHLVLLQLVWSESGKCCPLLGAVVKRIRVKQQLKKIWGVLERLLFCSYFAWSCFWPQRKEGSELWKRLVISFYRTIGQTYFSCSSSKIKRKHLLTLSWFRF